MTHDINVPSWMSQMDSHILSINVYLMLTSIIKFLLDILA